jgi:AsmA-like C-terminal region/AsmA family
MPKWLRYTLWTLFIVIILLVLITTSLTYFYRHSVAQAFKDSLSKTIQAKWQYQSPSFNYYTKWGELTLTYHHNTFESPTDRQVFASIGQLGFSFGIWDILWGKYTVQKIYIENGEFKGKVDNQGKSNLQNIFTLNQSAEPFTQLKLNTIYIQNLKTSFENQRNQEIYSYTIRDAQADFEKWEANFPCRLKAQLDNFQFLIQQKVFWEQKEIALESRPSYEPATRRLNINETNINIKQSRFSVRGHYDFKSPDADMIDLKFRGRNNDLKPLLAFLPERYYENGAGFKIKGSFSFLGSIQGEWNHDQKPNIEVSFGGKNLTLVSPHTARQVLDEVSLSGSFSNGEQNGLASSSIRIQNLSGKLNNQRFKGNFYLVNLVNPSLSFDIEAGIDLGALHEFYPLEKIDRIRGLLGIKLNFDGELSELRLDDEENKRFTANGEIELVNTEFKFIGNPLVYSKLNTKWVFNNNVVDVKTFIGKVGNSDLKISGSFQNMLPYWLLPQQKLHLKGTLTTPKLDLEELLAKGNLSEDDKSAEIEKYDYTLVVPAGLQWNIRMICDTVVFRRFRGARLTADISLKEKVFKSGNLNVQVAGGTMSLLGILNAQKENFITFDGRVIFKNTDADKVFYIFENFSQKFLQDKNLQGRLDADIVAGLVMDKHLRPSLPSLAADVHSRMYGGELKDFVLLEDIARRIQAGNLKNLRFKEMRNILQIRNKTLFIPETEISGINIPISLIGRSTTDKGLDYKVRIQTTGTPINPNASVLRVRNNIVHYLTIKGNPESFRVNYTEVPNKAKLEENWQREKQSYLKLFNKQSRLNEPFKIDTIRIGY